MRTLVNEIIYYLGVTLSGQAFRYIFLKHVLARIKDLAMYQFISLPKLVFLGFKKDAAAILNAGLFINIHH